MSRAQEYDIIIIGAGQAGGPLATAMAAAGWKTALVERQHVGGTCVNEGCTPTKTLVASARIAYLARRAADYGVQTGPVAVDMQKVRQRKRDIVDSFRSGSERRMKSTPGLDLIMGAAHFSGPRTVEVTLQDGALRILSAAVIVIDTGARSRNPSLPGLGDVPFLDSTSIMELAEVPQHLLVIGGGYIGLEFGQMFRRFGSHVTIIQQRDQLLPREDADMAGEIADILRQDGVDLLLESRPVRVESTEDGQIRLAVSTPQGERTLTGSHLLLATGRIPNTDELNLASVGIQVDAGGFIPVNERLETGVPGVYAVGDVKGGPAFTHISYDDYRVLRANLLLAGNASITGRMAPYVVFIDPQLGRVGLTETEASGRRLNYRVAKMPMSGVARALETDESRGVMKVLVDADTGLILGAAILGMEGGELMAVLQMAMMGGLPYTALRDAVFAHPTLAEAFNNLFATIDA